MNTTPPLEPRTVQNSATDMTELVLPPHTNALGTVFGGQVMAWIDICAAIAAQRHCGRVAVTAAVDELTFRAPIHLGDVVCLTAWLNEAFGSSMEVQVRVEVEDRQTRARTLCADALLTFVNLDHETGRPLSVPPLKTQTPDEEKRRCDAHIRRKARLAKRNA